MSNTNEKWVRIWARSPSQPGPQAYSNVFDTKTRPSLAMAAFLQKREYTQLDVLAYEVSDERFPLMTTDKGAERYFLDHLHEFVFTRLGSDYVAAYYAAVVPVGYWGHYPPVAYAATFGVDMDAEEPKPRKPEPGLRVESHNSSPVDADRAMDAVRSLCK